MQQFDERFDRVDARSEVVETTLRDLAEQLVVLGRGVEVAIETRSQFEERVDDHERPIEDLEKRLPT